MTALQATRTTATPTEAPQDPAKAPFLPRRTPIGPEDVVSVQGRYLVRHQRRFFLQGMAFPTAPMKRHDYSGYNADGWIAVLEQLANTTDINAVRVYQLDCDKPPNFYEAFLRRAAALGLYVLIPLTAPSGPGVLDRDKPAPHCYAQSLYDYGKRCLQHFRPYPNVLAGVIGNEVMNSLDAWQAAPCVKAYAHDLQQYMMLTSDDARLFTSNNTGSRPLPLLYAAQHDSMAADVLPEQAMKLTLDYLTCRTTDDDHQEEEITTLIFGINVESWCSSLQTFRYDEDGISKSGYYALWETLQNATVPLVFSEMGCAKNLFNRDNGMSPHMIRDWKQIPVVLDDMGHVFSGFCAYAYDGNPIFRMMHKSWNGREVLKPTEDFENFRKQLHAYVYSQGRSVDDGNLPTTSGVSGRRPSCQDVVQQLKETCDLTLHPMERMPSYFRREQQWSAWRRCAHSVGLVVGSSLVMMLLVWWHRKYYGNKRNRNPQDGQGAGLATVQTTYQSIASQDEEA